jgi:cholesterol transport system auxiliary component
MKYLLAAMFSMLILAGCGSFFRSHAPAATTYQLSVAPHAAGAPIDADLAVLGPHVRGGLDNDRIAALYPDRRLDYFARARWSAPLDEMLLDLTLQAFRGAAALRNVDTDASAFTSAYWLELDVVDFQAEYQGAGSAAGEAPSVHVHLVGRIGGGGDRHLLGQVDAETRQQAASNRLTAVVEAYNQAVDQALSKVVAETTGTVRRNLESR